MQLITPFLWFNGRAEEAVNFYLAIFPRSKVLKTLRYDEASARATGTRAGAVMTIEFELNGQRFVALNGGPQFPFTEAISFVVNCRTQREVDRYWEKLGAGGVEVQCGWLKDKFGVSWQIVPTALGKLLETKDAATYQRVIAAMLKMVKLEVAELKAAAKGKRR